MRFKFLEPDELQLLYKPIPILTFEFCAMAKGSSWILFDGFVVVRRELIRKVFTVVLEIAFTMNYIQTRVKFQKNKGSKRNDQIPHVLKCRIQK